MPYPTIDAKHSYKMLMLLNRIKYKGITCFFRTQIKKIFDYCYYSSFPFANYDDGIDWIINYYLKKYRNTSLENTTNSAKITFPIINWKKQSWKINFPKDYEKIIEPKFGNQSYKYDDLPNELPIEITFMKEITNNYKDNTIKVVRNVKSRLETSFVKNLMMGRRWRFNPAICDNPELVIKIIYFMRDSDCFNDKKKFKIKKYNRL